ncbi:MAG: AAA family ATPase [Anaerolineales bacterium]
MPDRMLESLSIQGYKSFRELNLSLEPVNVLIGANGSGKSNFIGLFKMLNRMMKEELQLYVVEAGGADQILHYGRRVTDKLSIQIWFKMGKDLANGYYTILRPVSDSLYVAVEALYFHDRSSYPKPKTVIINHEVIRESKLPKWAQQKPKKSIASYVYEAMHTWQLYHFNDTSEAARLKQMGDLSENRYLLPDAGNLAAYLYFLRERHPKNYRNIVETIRLAAPFFGDFILRPHPFNPEKIRLEWRERGSDLTFAANALSDGTLRFICLTTLLLQPPEYLPSIILLDEPELGLHPYAIVLLGEMIHAVSEHAQVLLATQSVSLVNQFAPQEILVVDRAEDLSTIRRLNEAEISQWLQDYALGELWEKNVIGGRPSW